ncbi:fatty-acid oxidation protein subunit alpha [Brasilonema sp. CT11]|nr:fatty-acid oxidation protein subunit alpha [Brasilonema sp. CT11]
MPAKDIYHNTVKNALMKDGWTITHDPLRIRLARGRNLFVDLGAERLLAAERGKEKIAVEVTRYAQIQNSKYALRARYAFAFGVRFAHTKFKIEDLYLAVSENTGRTVFEEEAGQTLIDDGIIRLVTFNPSHEVIIRWIY